MIGRVISTKLKNTATVLIEREKVHKLYKKAFARSKKYLVDDPIGVKNGDIVNIEKCKPISKKKHFKITKVLGQNLAEITEAQLKQKAEETISEVMPEEKIGDRVQGVGSSEETKKTETIKGKQKKMQKEKLAPKP